MNLGDVMKYIAKSVSEKWIDHIDPMILSGAKWSI